MREFARVFVNINDITITLFSGIHVIFVIFRNPTSTCQDTENGGFTSILMVMCILV